MDLINFWNNHLVVEIGLLSRHIAHLLIYIDGCLIVKHVLISRGIWIFNPLLDKFLADI